MKIIPEKPLGTLIPGLVVLAVFYAFLCPLSVYASFEETTMILNTSSLLSIYKTDIPRPVSKEWDFPTGFSLGISGKHHFRTGSGGNSSYNSVSKVNLYPLNLLMKYSLYHTRRLSQSIGVGFGPYLSHEGPMPLQMEDLTVTCGSTYLTEWVTEVSKNLCFKLRMKYTHSLQSIASQIPLGDFTTWLGLDASW